MTDQVLPLKLPKIPTLIIWGSVALTIGERLIWFHDWDLDTSPKRSFMSNEGMSSRLGGYMGWKAVEQIRGRLRRLGLHLGFRRPGFAQFSWVSTLPPQFVAHSADHVKVLQVQFDAYIRERDAWLLMKAERQRGDAETDAPAERRPSDIPTTLRQINDGVGSDTEGGKGGEPPVSSPVTESQLLSPVRDRETRVIAHAIKPETGELHRLDGESTSDWLERVALDQRREWDAPVTPERAARIRGRLMSGETRLPKGFDRPETIAWLDRVIAGQPEPDDERQAG